MVRPHSRICLLAVFSMLAPSGLAALPIRLAADELTAAAAQFPRPVADQRREEAYEALGRVLARSVIQDGEAAVGGIRVMRIASADYRLGADIITLDTVARPSNHLQSLVTGYIQEAFADEPDARDTARRVLWYNAILRTNPGLVEERYSEAVGQRVEKQFVGLPERADSWPGRSQVFLPTRALRGGGSAIGRGGDSSSRWRPEPAGTSSVTEHPTPSVDRLVQMPVRPEMVPAKSSPLPETNSTPAQNTPRPETFPGQTGPRTAPALDPGPSTRNRPPSREEPHNVIPRPESRPRHHENPRAPTREDKPHPADTPQKPDVRKGDGESRPRGHDHEDGDKEKGQKGAQGGRPESKKGGGDGGSSPGRDSLLPAKPGPIFEHHTPQSRGHREEPGSTVPSVPHTPGPASHPEGLSGHSHGGHTPSLSHAHK
ncbi:MAG: hypothetical protein HY042_04575 [Spirochaetia bacterium]|nr:hypothetical protein [Spirochaetia bacterium]